MSDNAVPVQNTPVVPQSQVEPIVAPVAPQVVAEEAKIDQNPNLSPTEKQQAKKMLREIEYKYNNKVIKEKLPFDIPDDPIAIKFMQDQMQLSKLSKVKAQEKSELETELKDFFSNLVKNPRKVLADPTLGIDFKKMVQEYLEEEIANSKKTPEQIESERLKAELKALREEKETQSKEKEELRKQMLYKQEAERYDTMIGNAIEKSDLPKSEYVVKKIADYLLLGLEQGIEVPMEDIIPMVREEIQNDVKQMMGMMPEDAVERFLGKEFFDKKRKSNITKAKASPKLAAPMPKEAEKKQSIKDFFKL